MGIDLNRRAFIAGASVAAVGVTAPVLAVSGSADTGIDQAIATFRATSEASSRFHDRVFTPANAAWRRAVDALPHYETGTVFTMGGGRSRPLTTANDHDVLVAKSIARDCRPTSDPFNAACHELAAAAEGREQQSEVLKQRFRVSELGQQSDDLGGVSAKALWAVELYPVTNVRELLLKAEVLEEAGIEEVEVETLLTDLRRITGRAS